MNAKRVLSALTVIALFVACAESGRQSGKTGGFRWQVNEDGVAITGHTGRKTEIEIPSEIRGMPVTEIGPRAFSGRQLTAVTIPETVRRIGSAAFLNNLLTGVAIPDSVVSIGNGAFFGNEITKLEMGAGLVSIGDFAFAENRLAYIAIPASVTYIGESAFENSEPVEIASNDVDENLVSIPEDLSAGVDISELAFAIVDVPPPGGGAIGAATMDGVVPVIRIPPPVSLPQSAQAATPPSQVARNDVATVALPPVVSVAPPVVSVIPQTLPTNVETTTGQTGNGENIFTVSISDDGMSATITGLREGGGNTEILIPARIRGLPVTAIGVNAFEGSGLTGAVIPNGVVSIGSRAFADNRLTRIVIPGSVNSIGPEAFMGNRISSAVIPNGVVSIGSRAFANNSLTSVSIPDTIVDIWSGTFANNQLATVTIGGNVRTIGRKVPWENDGAFANNRLVAVTIPDGVSSIEEKAFDGNPLRSVTIGNNVVINENGGFDARFAMLYDAHGRVAGTYALDDGEWLFQAR